MKRRWAVTSLLAVTVCIFLGFSNPACATIWYVDDDAPGDPGPGDPSVSDPAEGGSINHPFDSIQEAIDTSDPNDTVIVADGTYTGDGNRDIDFMGKVITVRSENGPENCIINCEGAESDLHRGFYFKHGEDANSVLDGFTITNGFAYMGGGIRCRYSSSPTISNCIICGNVSAFSPGFPGKIALNGGGIYCSLSSSPIIEKCCFLNNIATGSGGAISSYDGNALVRNCLFSGNKAGSNGGAIGLYQDNMSIYNCVITGNRAGTIHYLGGGGGIYSSRSTPKIDNCSISNNSAYRGGGVYLKGGEASISNNILWDNAAPEGHEIGLRYSGFDWPTLTVSYCNVQNGSTGIYLGSGSTLNWSEGNINVEPYFVEPGYWDSNGTPDDPNDDIWVDGDYHLGRGSACIDAGSEVGVYEDIEGKVRPWDYPGVDNNGDEGEFDMGAYEYVGVEAGLKLTPRTLNCRSQGKWVKAHLVLPEGYAAEDIDPDTPAMLQPLGLTSEQLKVSVNEDGLVKVDATFDREAFCGAAGDLSEGVTVFGYFADGSVFYGTASVRIITPGIEELAELSAYWLRSGCEKPDWCGGLDLNRDSAVNMLDFALFGKIEMEFIDS